MAKHTKARKQKPNGNGLEQTLWLATDKLRKNIDTAEYKHIALGLIFLSDWSITSRFLRGLINDDCRGN